MATYQIMQLNSFALATFLSLISKWKYSYTYYVVAFLIALSRVYLGVHYPFDVISGAILGSLWAYLFYRLYKKRGPLDPYLNYTSSAKNNLDSSEYVFSNFAGAKRTPYLDSNSSSLETTDLAPT